MAFLLALDQGTTSSRAVVFDSEGTIVAMAQQEISQIYPAPGWVEHDPDEIWNAQLETARQALRKAGLTAREIAAVGITNQRETTLVWDRISGRPIYNAIVWQDRRTAARCSELVAADREELFRERTGLVLDPYFSGTKLAWLLDYVPGARAHAERGELAFGTVDSWLLWRLTHGRAHATDISNAARTLMFDIHRICWDPQLLEILEIPPAVLPAVFPSSHLFGHCDPEWLGASVPIGGIAGDQQAALFGQACFEPGMAKNTYGTGCFMLMHLGAVPVRSGAGLLVTAAAQGEREKAYALEGSVFVGGAVVQWLRDGLGIIRSAAEIEALAASVADSGGVVMVPAFTGLGSPYWDPYARGALLGLSRGTNRAHIARAALESIAFQSAELIDAMQTDAACPIRALRVDGGASGNNLLMQMQADLLGIPVVRPRVTETTALGAAWLAGLSCGVWSDLAELASLWTAERVFEPVLGRDEVLARMTRWREAVKRSQHWAAA